MEIAIIGAGAAGLSFALLLQKKGHKVTVYDKNMKRPSFDHGVALDGNSIKILQELDLFEFVEKTAVRVTKAKFYNNDSKIAEFSIDEIKIENPLLFAISLEALENELENRVSDVKRGVEVISCSRKGDKTVLEFSDKEEKAFDLVIASDGSNSSMREMLNIDVDTHVYPFELDILVKRRNKDVEDCPMMKFVSGRTFLLAIPYSKERSMVIRVIYSKKPPIDISDIAKEDIEFQSKIPLEKKLASIFYKDGVLLHGDTAHRMTPFGGKGLNLSLADAKIYSEFMDKDLALVAKKRRNVAKKVLRETHFLANNVGRGRVFVVFLIKMLNRYKKFFAKLLQSHFKNTM